MRPALLEGAAMSPEAWLAFGTVGAATVAMFGTISVALIRLAQEILGKKKEESLREMIERHYEENSTKTEKLEKEVKEIWSTIYRYHPREV